MFVWIIHIYLVMILPAKFKFCKLSQLRSGSEMTKAKKFNKKKKVYFLEGVGTEVKMLLFPYLNWKSCWQINWVQKEAEETLKELNLWCYFQRGPVSPNLYTPRRIQDHVFLQDIQHHTKLLTTISSWILLYQFLLTMTPQFKKQYWLQIKFSCSWLEQCSSYLLKFCIWKNKRNGTAAQQDKCTFLFL